MPEKPKPKPRYRILRPEVAKARATPTTPDPTTSANEPKQTPLSDSTTSQQVRRKPGILDSFRARYATLPHTVKRGVRALPLLATVVPIGMFISQHIYQIVWVRGPSMQPYLNEQYEQTTTEGDVVLVKMLPWFMWPWQKQGRIELQRGMIVTFPSPANPNHTAAKRIIGLPGDKITTREPHMRSSQIVPFNHVWMEGDAQDPKKTLDSNTYGPVSVSMITGRVVAVLRPHFRRVNWEDWENGVFKGLPGEEYGKDVRNRVLKDAVNMESAQFE